MKVRNPEKWVGKRPPKGLEWAHCWRELDLCDACQRLYHPDDLHPLLLTQSEADVKLQRAVRVEEAQGFCPDCLAQIEAEADAIDAGWRKRHGYD